MSRLQRRKGRYLEALSAHDMARITTANADLATLHNLLLDYGYSLVPSSRPYLRADRSVTLRFVWRKREPGMSLTVSRSIVVRI
jgi:hypothetical protein